MTTGLRGAGLSAVAASIAAGVGGVFILDDGPGPRPPSSADLRRARRAERAAQLRTRPAIPVPPEPVSKRRRRRLRGKGL
jgi:hypothetical protein